MTVGGQTLRLVGLAEEVADRFMAEFPDEMERHGERGHEWCIHDNHYLLAWAAGDLESRELLRPPPGPGLMERQVAWLSDVLAARGYPLERVARDLEIAADVVMERGGPAGPAVRERLLAGADLIRRRVS
jgi:hypothetical protein